MVLVIMCIIREFLGGGSFGGGLIDTANGFRITLDGTGSGVQIFPSQYAAGILKLPFGGFLTLGCLIALVQYLMRRSDEKKAAKKEEAK